MDNPTYDEAIYIVRIKRERAKQVMARLVERFGVISNEPAPGLEVLLDYFINMVYGLELLLKVLAKDWETPGNSKFKHRVGQMYAEVFGHTHADPAFMKELEDAILDQKFICEPAKGLIDRVKAIETLWDELKIEYSRRSWGQLSSVVKEVKASAAFGQYLLQNIARFTPPPIHRDDPMTTEQKIAMRRLHIEHLQGEITRLEEGDSPKPTMSEMFNSLRQEFDELVSARESCMAMNFRLWNTSELEFSIHRMGIAWDDLG